MINISCKDFVMEMIGLLYWSAFQIPVPHGNVFYNVYKSSKVKTSSFPRANVGHVQQGHDW
jgi:hypothetical protein